MAGPVKWVGVFPASILTLGVLAGADELVDEVAESVEVEGFRVLEHLPEGYLADALDSQHQFTVDVLEPLDW